MIVDDEEKAIREAAAEDEYDDRTASTTVKRESSECQYYLVDIALVAVFLSSWR